MEPITGEIAALYNRVAAEYGRVGPPVFAHFGRRLVELASIAEGAQVLDVAAGRGAVLFPAADRVGSAGRVVGVDLAEAMVRETTAEIARRGLTNAIMLQMDAESLAFPDASFDHVVCAFAIFFLDVERALTEFRRVLRPGGMVAVTGATDGDERWRWYNDLLVAYRDRYGVALSPPRRGASWQPDELPSLLARAGFVDIRETVEEAEITYAGEGEWWASKWTHGARYPLERMPPAVLERFKAEALERLHPLRRPDGFHERWRIRCVMGRRPAQ